ncbi:hypothetical protein [Sphingobacterium hotanense]|uniref:hypothetical protein n=1 Tax=Sphingobacterium hotanense TaxID=649196 RepID=UPI0021A2BB6A|nr:hypothetical protein [Sphingobacterium hotanense]MCT1524141.1 hypothetical protein [Sphingobacterium hotanense]
MNGGQLITNFPIDSSIHIIPIPAIYKDEITQCLLPVDKSVRLEECFEQRIHKIEAVIVALKPDFIITEHFPFGFLFKEEALHFIQESKKYNKSVKVIGSVRDVIECRTVNSQDNVSVDILNRFYDLLLVHGDENLLGLRDSFPLYDDIKVDILHTGYVVSNISGGKKLNFKDMCKKPNTIIVSVGAGRLGAELLDMVKEAFLLLNDQSIQLILFTGVFQHDKAIYSNMELASNIHVVGFDRDLYLQYLQKADLVISLGGYNSII